jgi:hypothetical protein
MRSQGVETHVNGVLERVTVKTVGIKNMDVRELKGVPLPRALFNTKNLKTKQVRMCSAHVYSFTKYVK